MTKLKSDTDGKYSAANFTQGFYKIYDREAKTSAIYKVYRKKGILISSGGQFIGEFNFNTGHTADSYTIWRLTEDEVMLEML